jgi:hypothetical protein
MAIALVTSHRDVSRRKKKLTLTGTLSGNYAVGGVPIDFTTVTNPKMASGGKPAANPTFGEVTNQPGGYAMTLIQGTTMKNWLLKIWTAPGTEMTVIAIPAAIIAEPVIMELTGPLGNF